MTADLARLLRYVPPRVASRVDGIGSDLVELALDLGRPLVASRPGARFAAVIFMRPTRGGPLVDTMASTSVRTCGHCGIPCNPLLLLPATVLPATESGNRWKRAPALMPQWPPRVSSGRARLYPPGWPPGSYRLKRGVQAQPRRGPRARNGTSFLVTARPGSPHPTVAPRRELRVDPPPLGGSRT